MSDDIESVLALARESHAEVADIRFTDLLGAWHQFTVPIARLDEKMFAEGLGFDGSSIAGFQSIEESDMLLLLDPTTALVDPVSKTPALSIIANIHDPITREPYSRDSRYIAQKALQYMRGTGIADQAFFGPEAEFFLFNGISFGGQKAAAGGDGHYAHYEIESAEGDWNNAMPAADPHTRRSNLGYRPRNKEGYFPAPPIDSLREIRNDITLHLEQAGIEVELHHHETASGGQCEIGIRLDELLPIADKMQWHKYIIRNVAFQHGLTATFMPKPIFGDNGSGMHTHQSLWKDGETLMYDERGYGGLSDLARWYLGGILYHAPALLAFTNPSTNSYRRLIPGYEAPIYLVYSQRNRSAAVRIPISKGAKSKRIEFRTPDATCNIYLALAAQLMAGLDGIKNKYDPGDPVDRDLYELPPEIQHDLPTVPASLGDALDALREDQDFLLSGNVFTQDLLDAYIALKEKDVEAIRLRPHPYEFHMYFDA